MSLDIGVVERRVDLVEHADRRGVGEEQPEDQRHRGQRLLTARQQCQRLQLFARRLRHDLEPRFERIVRIDQFEMRSEEHTSELQSLMRISYAVFCLKKKKKRRNQIRKNELNV